jgi:serine/threonine protein kinase
VTARTDVFNFGATLYKVLTGRVVPTLFTTGSKTNSFVSVDMVAAPNMVRPDVPAALSSLVMECIRSQPHTRPSGMHDLIYRLELVEHAMSKHGSVAQRDVPAHADMPAHLGGTPHSASHTTPPQPPVGA